METKETETTVTPLRALTALTAFCGAILILHAFSWGVIQGECISKYGKVCMTYLEFWKETLKFLWALLKNII